MFPARLCISCYIASQSNSSTSPARSHCVTESLAPATTLLLLCHFLHLSEQWAALESLLHHKHTHTHTIYPVCVCCSRDGNIFFTPPAAEKSLLFSQFSTKSNQSEPKSLEKIVRIQVLNTNHQNSPLNNLIIIMYCIM